jgi:para-aminobenzoate synthetase / 4-amino-4-deoxychorismate lyase
MRTALFESGGRARQGWRAGFDQPQAVHIAHTHREVLPVIQLAEAAALAGRWVAMMLSYEAAGAFDPAMKTHSLSDFPLAWAAVFAEPASSASAPSSATPPAAHQVSSWQPQVSQAEYIKSITNIHERIIAGDTYQVNYTFPLKSRFRGDAWSWYGDLKQAQQADYCAYIDLGRYLILCLSPELFFERQGDHLTTRPMKGTRSRGRWLEEDDEQAARLRASAKERAENLMIVDLLRNDLGKISVIGSVGVPQLFAVERYPTVLQMTSEVTSRCRPGTRLADIFQALFPCGSITGAPKLRTMEIIRELEPGPRRIYTGAIGYLRPGGDCVFNVAIRTLLLDRATDEVTFGVGGGITFDSTAAAEYEECALKASFLTRRATEFQLVETLLLEEGVYFLLERHLDRIAASARYFGFSWNDAAMRKDLADICLAHQQGKWKVRLLSSDEATVAATAERIDLDRAKPYAVAFAAEPVDGRDPALFHKTTDRRRYEKELQRRPDCDDIIFWNEGGEVTESSIANVVLISEGRKWTPPRASGLLRGTFADALLDAGELCERTIYKDELLRARTFYLINSVRKWMEAVLVN